MKHAITIPAPSALGAVKKPFPGTKAAHRSRFALVVLGLTTLVLANLGHAASTSDRPRATTIPPSWITPLSLDWTSVEGAIGVPDDADYFRIDVKEMTEAVIYTVGGLDTVGVLLDSEGRELTTDDDGGEEGNFSMTELLWPGEYYLRVTSSPLAVFDNLSPLALLGNLTGSYSLTAGGSPVSPAALLLNGPPLEGEIATRTADYFRIEVTELVEAAIYTVDSPYSIGTLLDAEGREIATDDAGGEADGFRITTPLWPGEYYLRVSKQHSESGTAASDPPGDYTLRAEGRPVLSFTDLPLDRTPQEGVIERAGDADFFRIEASEETAVIIRSTGSVDTLGVLLDSHGRTIRTDDNRGEEGNFLLYAVVEAGEYYVQVTASPSAIHWYTTGRFTLAADGTPVSPVQLSLNGTPHGGVIETEDEFEIYRIDVEMPTEVVLYTTGGFDSGGTLLDSEGITIALDDDGGEGTNFRLGGLLFTGVYHLFVGAADEFGGGYTLHFEGTQLAPTPTLLGGLPKQGAIETPGDADYYHIEISEPTATVLYSTGGLDTAAILYDPDGKVIDWDDDRGQDLVNFYIATVLFRSGEYLLRVLSSSNSTGSYTLHTSGIPEAAPEGP